MRNQYERIYSILTVGPQSNSIDEVEMEDWVGKKPAKVLRGAGKLIKKGAADIGRGMDRGPGGIALSSARGAGTAVRKARDLPRRGRRLLRRLGAAYRQGREGPGATDAERRSPKWNDPEEK